LTTLTLLLTDKGGRPHNLNIKLPSEYPKVKPECWCDIPEAVEFPWDSNVSTLQNVATAYVETFAKYQDFWDVMDDIDAMCCVLEPKNPTRADTFRRIVLAPHVSMQMTIEPTQAHAVPQCQFFGAEKKIESLFQKLNKNLQSWNHSSSMHANLEHVLNLKLPSPETENIEVFSEECVICYQYRREDGSVPSKICDKPNCARPYHNACLYAWLRSVPNNRESFGTVYGKCVFCDAPISAKIN